MRISCDSNYAVYINDALAAFGQYADYPWYKVYDEIELSTFFTVGVNCIKIIVWYYGENFSTYYKGNRGYGTNGKLETKPFAFPHGARYAAKVKII